MWERVECLLSHICNFQVCVVYIAHKKDFSYTNHGKIKTKIQIHSVVLTFYNNPFQSFMASKTSNKHWSKVNSTYRLKVGNKENEKFEERKKMEF